MVHLTLLTAVNKELGKLNLIIWQRSRAGVFFDRVKNKANFTNEVETFLSVYLLYVRMFKMLSCLFITADTKDTLITTH